SRRCSASIRRPCARSTWCRRYPTRLPVEPVRRCNPRLGLGDQPADLDDRRIVMTSLTTRRSALAVLPLLIAATAPAQTGPVQGAEGWTPERVRAFVVKTYPTVLAGDTAIGHVHILLDAAGQFVRRPSGKSDSVRVGLAGGGGGPSTGRIDGFRINKDGSIDPIS